jgi:gas vesicle protein
MGQDPEVIRQQIEETRENMGETVDALGYKTDVKSRAKDSVSGKTNALRSKFSGATDAAPSSGDVKQGAQKAAGVAQENPLGLALAGVAVGFVAGMLVPSTRVEDEKIGAMADQVKEKVKETGSEALEHGKEVAQEAAQSAKETAQEKGQERAEELRSSAQDKAQEARPTA